MNHTRANPAQGERPATTGLFVTVVVEPVATVRVVPDSVDVPLGGTQPLDA